jgi:molybdopterin-guanine dinucleotide biosynthesis protein A
VAGFGVVVLAGGAGKRLGGSAKPTLPVAGKPMLVRVLEAVSGADECVVVGPPALGSLVAGGVRVVQEEPAGGGPVAGLAAGVAAVVGGGTVVVLAADLPLLTAEAVGQLVGALGQHDGAVFVDRDGRRQWLCGAWSVGALRRRIGEMAGEGPLGGRSMREFVASLDVVGVPVGGDGGSQPWYDCDTPAELAGAESELGGG